MELNLEKVVEAVAKTGFKLEYEIGVLLKKNGWQLISNRCYADDLGGTVREIDILAYKVSKIDEISVYTVVVVSCKKSESNAWALFSRPVDKNDPNYDWKPFKGWCNHPALSYYINQDSWAQKYHEYMVGECQEVFMQPTSDVFAFQEISKNNYTPQNDKNIFSSITSLMKAQAYELGLLEHRKRKEKCLYQFNLVSVVQSNLVNVSFSDGELNAYEVNSEEYICRYIINGKEERSRIKFVCSDYFAEAIVGYSKLHKKNVNRFRALYEEFYADCYKDVRKLALVLPEFVRLARPEMQRALFRLRLGIKKFSDLTVYWYEPSNSLTVGVISDDLDLNDILILDADVTLKNEIAKVLKYVFRYEGAFSIELDIPF